MGMKKIGEFPSAYKNESYVVRLWDGKDYTCTCPQFSRYGQCAHTAICQGNSWVNPMEVVDNRLVVAVVNAFKEAGIDLRSLIDTYTPYTYGEKLPAIMDKIKARVVRLIADELEAPRFIETVKKETKVIYREPKAKEPPEVPSGPARLIILE